MSEPTKRGTTTSLEKTFKELSGEVTKLFTPQKSDQECECSFCRPAVISPHTLPEAKKEPIIAMDYQRVTERKPPPLIPTSLVRRNDVLPAKDDQPIKIHENNSDPTMTPAQNATLLDKKKVMCICSFCSKSFTTTRALELHVRRHSGLRPYPCKFCDKSFYQPSERAVHMRTHTGARPYRCPHCLKLFRYSGDLKQHINIHTGQRPYQCEICSKAFTNHSTLRQHKRIHTGERPYRCLECGKNYRYHSSLKQHRSSHLKKAGLQALMTSSKPRGSDVKVEMETKVL